MRERLSRSGSGGKPRRGFSLVLSSTAAFAYIVFLRPAEGLENRAALMHAAAPFARPAAEVYGRSGRVRMRFALPSTQLEYPLEIPSDTTHVRYAWIPLYADSAPEQPREAADGLVAPSQPGFYRLVLFNSDTSQYIDSLALAVMVPFSQKSGSTLNGYRIGFYRAERNQGARSEPPAGFVEIDTTHLELPVSDHLRLRDFVSHDYQSTWPRYAAVDMRLLDKIELVFEEIESWYGGPNRAGISFDVRSGFRTPLHNRRVSRAASDSRHQYGDAMDLSVDANRDGHVNAADTKLLALAVEIVERAHPELVGGMGVYTRSGTAYVHIDTRGQRVRWRG
jgi:uncharacterized protein YcbK (DUF882 family)